MWGVHEHHPFQLFVAQLTANYVPSTLGPQTVNYQTEEREYLSVVWYFFITGSNNSYQ